MVLAQGTRTRIRLPGSMPLPAQGLSTSAPLTFGTASPCGGADLGTAWC